MDAYPESPVRLILLSPEARECASDCVELLGQFGVAHCVDEVPPANLDASILLLFGEGCLAAPVPTSIPVLRVPLDSGDCEENLRRLKASAADPDGIPTLAIGKAGARNAALFAVSVLALRSSEIAEKLREFRETQTSMVMEESLPEPAL